MIVCLYNEELKPYKWKDIKATIHANGFIDSLKEKFASLTVHTVPSNPDYKASWFNADYIAAVSKACSLLVQMAQDYLRLQESLQSPVLIAWIELQDQLKALEKLKGIYERVGQGMPEKERKARADAKRAQPHPPAGQKQPMKPESHLKAKAKKAGQ